MNFQIAKVWDNEYAEGLMEMVLGRMYSWYLGALARIGKRHDIFFTNVPVKCRALL